MNDLSVIINNEAPAKASSAVWCNVTAIVTLVGCDAAQQVAETLESVFSQTSPPDQLVIVVDHTVLHEQDAVIKRYSIDKRVPLVDVLSIKGRADLASAMNAGLALCKGDWVMCVAGGDVCHPERLAIQLDYVARHPDVDVFGSWWETPTVKGTRIATCGVHQSAIVNALRWSNVLLHSSLLVRASVLHEIGGYSPRFADLADYDLVIRLATNNTRFRIIPAVLVAIEAQRRHLWCDLRFRFACWRSGLLTFRQYVMVTLVSLAKQLTNRPSRPASRIIRWIAQPTGQA